jgi:hypothetical protein
VSEDRLRSGRLNQLEREAAQARDVKSARQACARRQPRRKGLLIQRNCVSASDRWQIVAASILGCYALHAKYVDSWPI